MRNQADRKRYLIGLLGERGKAKKKNYRYIAFHKIICNNFFTFKFHTFIVIIQEYLEINIFGTLPNLTFLYQN
jgi:hypothetical protein